MKSCFIPAFSLWFVITDKLEFFRFLHPLDTFTFLCQMFPIHSHRIFRSLCEYFICHAPKTYLLNAYFFLFFNVYFLHIFFSHFSNIFYHTKLHFKKHVSNNFCLRQSSIQRYQFKIIFGTLNNILLSLAFYLATNSVREFLSR